MFPWRTKYTFSWVPIKPVPNIGVLTFRMYNTRLINVLKTTVTRPTVHKRFVNALSAVNQRSSCNDCRVRQDRLSTEVTFGRGDLSDCPFGGFIGAQEHLISNWRGCPPGRPHRDKN